MIFLWNHVFEIEQEKFILCRLWLQTLKHCFLLPVFYLTLHSMVKKFQDSIEVSLDFPETLCFQRFIVSRINSN